jgi:hypothetical protein
MLKNLMLPILAVLSLTSCFDVTDKVTVQKDGSGSYQRVMDYTKSLEGMKAMALENDTALQKFVHSIDSSTRALYEKITSTPGITGEGMDVSENGVVFTLKFKFNALTSLNKAFSNMLDEAGSGSNAKGYFTLKKGKLSFLGGVPGIVNPTGKKMDEETLTMMKGMMGEASYGLTIESVGNAKKSSSKLWTMDGNKFQTSMPLIDLFETPLKSKADLTFK